MVLKQFKRCSQNLKKIYITPKNIYITAIACFHSPKRIKLLVIHTNFITKTSSHTKEVFRKLLE